MADDGWAGEQVDRWVRLSAGLEQQLAPVSDLLFASAALQPGEAVLDVGCGTGPTTRTAALLVSPGGRVTGLDIAAPMLEAAARIPLPDGAVTPEWELADAVRWNPPAAGYDAVISRFGVMFFSDPSAAFAALATATRPGGRLAMVVWCRRDDSELFRLPLHATLRSLADQGLPTAPPPEDEGPFSLHDQSAVRELLTATGWAEVGFAVHTVPMLFGGGLDPEAAAAAALELGPTRLVTEDLPADALARVTTTLAEALAAVVDEHGQVVLDGRVQVVTARRT